MRNQATFVNKTNSTILSVKRIWTITRKAACKRSIQVEVVFEEKVMQCVSKVMEKLCNERLMIYKGNFVEHNGSNPLPALMFLLMTKKILSTDNGQELHLVSLFPVRRSIYTKGNAGVHLAEE